MHARVHVATPALVNPIQCHEITRALRAQAMSLQSALWTMHSLYECMGGGEQRLLSEVLCKSQIHTQCVFQNIMGEHAPRPPLP